MAADRTTRADFEAYSGIARLLHWLVAVIVLGLVTSGLIMVYRGKDLNIWDDLTNNLYTTHKTAGLVLLALVIVRLGYRLINGAPSDEPTLTAAHRGVSHAVHWSIYALLLVIPLLGWTGISMFPALGTFGGFTIPALTSPDKETAGVVLWWHGLAAYVLISLILLHILAALYHHVIRGDNVLRRMLPGLSRRQD